MSKVKEKLRNYTVFYEPAEEGGYVVTVPALPGCVTEGDTFEEAQQMAREAIMLYLETLEEEGDEIPKESDDAVISKVSVSL